MKTTLHLTFSLLFILGTYLSQAQIRMTGVDPSTGTISIKNFGSTTVDISTYRYCHLFNYSNTVANMTIISGSTSLGAGQTLVQSGATLNATASDLGLYLGTGAFGDPNSMVDFVQWGSAGNGRESVAVTKGIWTAGDFISTPAPYAYSGNGATNGLSSWTAPAFIPIANIQDTTGTGTEVSPMDGVTGVTIRGEITGVRSNGYWMQDADAMWSGIFVFDNGHTHVVGEELELTGDVAEFNNVTQLSNTVATTITLGYTPAAVALSTATASVEAYESVLISVSNAAVTTVPNAGNFNETGIDDGSGAYLTDDYIYDYVTAGNFTTLGEKYDITGLGYFSFSAYKMLPRDANDIVLANVVSASATSTPTTCGNTDGTATASATGGTSPYTYLWNNAATSSVITGLPQGTYSVTVTETNGGTATASTIVNNSNGPSISVTATDETVAGANDGMCVVTSTGGAAPVIYLWTNGATSLTISGLAPGSYGVTCTDNGGCTASGSGTVNAGAPASNLTSIFAIQNTTITNGDSPLNGSTVTTRGVVTGVVINGTAAGTFFIQDGTGAWNGLYVFESGTTVSIGDSVEVTGTVSEFNNTTELVSVSAVTIISTGNTLPVSTVTTTLAANSEEWEGVLIQCLNATYINNPGNFGLWELNDNSGIIEADDDIFPYANIGTVGMAYNVTGIGHFSFGTFKILPRDINDIVDPNAAQPLVASAIATDATCGNTDGSVSSSATGGVTPYTYLWSNANETTTAVSNLGQGAYTVTITDNNGTTATATATVNNSNGPVVTLNATDASGAATADGSVTSTVTGGATPYTYVWSNSVATASITGLNPNTYGVTVTDNNSCAATASVVVADGSVNTNLTSIYDIQFSTAPNGDSPMNQNIITTRGVVTGVILSTFSATGTFFIQDGKGPWNGLYIFESGTAVAIGDSVEVTGKVDEFNGTTELVSVSNITILSSGNTLPDPHWIASTNDGNKEENEGVLLLTANAKYAANGANFVVILNDGSGDLIATDDIFQMKDVASVGTSYDVVGIGHYAFGAYRILPRDANDITIPTSVNELSSATNFAMYPNPASTSFTVELNDKAMVKLLDMKGALITSKNSSNNRVIFDVSNLNAGIYLVEVSSNNTVSHSKLIVR